MNNPPANIAHYPNHVCRNCKGKRFESFVEIKYDPLAPMQKYLVPVYLCQNCQEPLDLSLTPKKMTEQ